MTEFYFEPKEFEGKIGIDDDFLDVRFSAGIGRTGEVQIKFARFERTHASKFLTAKWDVKGTRFPYFSLAGKATDGAAFNTFDLIILSLGSSIFESEASLCPKVRCSTATITLPGPPGKNRITRRLCGFENFGILQAETKLGAVQMIGSNAETQGLIDGALSIDLSADKDIHARRKEADKLLSWISTVMSFAGAQAIVSPVTELHNNNELTIESFAQSSRQGTGLRLFSPLHQEQIFKCAVDSYFNSKITVRNIEYAVEWFTMRAVHAESNLIFAMTVLENLVESNLSNKEKSLLLDSQFSKFKQSLKDTLTFIIADYYEEGQRSNALSSYEDKLIDLNRKSLIQKIHLLAGKWNVSLAGITDGQIGAAKSARDKVVHRGKFSSPTDATVDLHDHLLVVRELAARFILTALRFQGKYFTYVEGYQERDMPKIDA